jgi:hypothetical protein
LVSSSRLLGLCRSCRVSPLLVPLAVTYRIVPHPVPRVPRPYHFRTVSLCRLVPFAPFARLLLGCLVSSSRLLGLCRSCRVSPLLGPLAVTYRIVPHLVPRASRPYHVRTTSVPLLVPWTTIDFASWFRSHLSLASFLSVWFHHLVCSASAGPVACHHFSCRWRSRTASYRIPYRAFHVRTTSVPFHFAGWFRLHLLLALS